LFQVMLVLQNNEAGTLELPGLNLSLVEEGGEGVSKYDLTLNVTETDQGLHLGWEYNTDLFDASTIARIARHFDSLLKYLVAAPEDKVFNADMLSADERQHLLVDWNKQDFSGSADRCVHQLFEMQVEKHPDAQALSFESLTLSYAELNKKSNQLANYLINEKNIKPDTLVGICVERSLDMVVGILAIQKAGGAYVPLDPEYPQARLQYMLDDANLSTVLTQSHLLKHTPITDAQALCLDDETLLQQVQKCSDDNPDAQALGLKPEHLAYVIYTSGSTGKPKGVMIEHRNIASVLSGLSHTFDIRADDCFGFLASVAFDIALFELFLSLVNGGRSIIIRRETLFDFDLLAQQLNDCTLLHGVPSLMSEINAYKNAHPSSFDQVRKVFVGGDYVPASLLRQLVATFSAADVVELYGPTEATILSTYAPVTEDILKHNKAVIGRGLSHSFICVLNSQGLLSAPGVVGELHIGGLGLARGYLNRDDLSAEQFITNPFYDKTQPNSRERLYKTGDLVRYLPDGNLEFLGRIDHQVKIRGFRIELGEIESTLNNHAAVNDAIVLAKETPENGDKRLVAYVVTGQAEGECDVEDLRQHLSQTLPEYMLPAAFVLLEQFPLTPNGKIDRKALPEPDAEAQQNIYVEPRTQTEKILCEVWQTVLNVEQVGINDNFFQLGGHSLLVMQVISHLQGGDQGGAQGGTQGDNSVLMTARQLFTAPRLVDLAALIDGESHKAEATAVFKAPENLIPEKCRHITPDMLPLVDLTEDDIARVVANIPGGVSNIQDIYALAPLQEGILFHHMMSTEGDPYVLPSVFKINGKQAVNEFIAALQFIINRHDTLRTAVLWKELSRPVQVVCRQASIRVDWLALEGVDDLDEEMRARCAPEKQSIDLGRAPLLQLQIAVAPESEQHFVLLQYHHITSDHVGLEIIQRELAFYLDGDAERLPAPVPYREFVAHAQYQAEQHDAEAFFSDMLGDIDEPTTPFNLLDTNGDGSRIVEAIEHVPAQTSANIRRLAKHLAISPAALFHAAWAMVVASCSGRDDVVFGTVLSGRLQGMVGVDNMLGVFINTLPLRVKLNNTNALGLLQQVQQSLINLLPYEQASLTLAQKCSGLAAGSPLFSAMLNYRHSAQVSEEEQGGSDAQLHDGKNGDVEVISVQERTNYPFNLSVDDLGQGFRLDVQVDNSVNAERVLAYMQTALAELAKALTSAPQTMLNTLSILPSEERQKLLLEWNDTAVKANTSINSKADASNDQCVHGLFEEQAENNPEAVAVIFDDQQICYGELNRKANQLAHYLLSEKQIKPEDLVGICVERSLDLIVCILAVLKAGGAYVPLDPDYPQARLQYMLDDAKVSTVITQQHLRGRTPVTDAQALYLDADAQQQQLQAQATTNPDRQALGLNTNNLAYVIYTSGSTGTPKGVLAEHRSIYNRVSWMEREFPALADDVFCQKTAAGFVDHVAEIFQALSYGKRLVVVPTSDILDAEKFVDIVAQQQITRLTLVPSLLKFLIDQGTLAAMPSLRIVISSGEALQLEETRAFYRSLPAARLLNLYGSSEIGADVSAYLIEVFDENPEVMQYFLDPVSPSSGASGGATAGAGVGEFTYQTPPSITDNPAFREQYSDSSLPQRAVEYQAYMDELSESVLPFSIDVAAQRFIGHMTSKLPSFIPELSRVITELNQNMVKVETSNNLTLIERQVLAVMHRMFFQLPSDFYDEYCQDPLHVFGMVTGGGSVANLTALWCARNRGLLALGCSQEDINHLGAHSLLYQQGFKGSVILGTRLMHYSMRKSVAVMGLGEAGIMHVAQDASQKMSMTDLKRCIEHCQKNQIFIIGIVGIAGATETGTVDPLDKIAVIAREHNIHFHADAAWGGAFLLSQHYRHRLAGIEYADSVTFCPHKQLYLSQGISLCLLRDTKSASSIATHAVYQSQKGSYDLGQYSVEGSRPAHALLLHASLHLLGQNGYSWLIEQGMSKTRYYVLMLENSDCFELVGYPDLNIITYRYVPVALRGKSHYTSAEQTQMSEAVFDIQQRQFASGTSFVSKTTIRLASSNDEPITVFRIVLSNPLTQFEDLRAVLVDQLHIANELLEAPADHHHNQLLGLSSDTASTYAKWQVPIGKPIQNTQLFILDGNMHLVPTGVCGELHVGGLGLARGYLNRQDLTDENFISNPFYESKNSASSERLYKTGDLARWLPDGNLEFSGRIDHQVKIRGFRIELGEIESILNTHADVSGAAVLAKDATNGDKRLVAYVVTEGLDLEGEGEAASAARYEFITGLGVYLQQSLPDYMVPAAFVLLPQLPLTPNGKLDRKALPDEADSGLQNTYLAPRTEIESTLCELWQDVLGLERVGVKDNFFQLGGHSLLATRLVARTNQALKVSLPLKSLFESQTLEGLAQVVSGLERGAIYPALVPVSRGQVLPSSFAQQRLWLLDKIDGGSAHYNMPSALTLTGSLDVDALNQAFSHILERHESLRTCFSAGDDGQAVQRIQTPAPFVASLFDLSTLDAAEKQTQLTGLVVKEGGQRFDLSQDLMLRAQVIKLGSEEHLLLVTMHHIASDGWSVSILIKEFSTLYTAYSQGQASPLVPLSIQYADYAAWQRHWLQGEVLDQHLSYWEMQLEDLPVVHSLPLDHARPSVQSFNGDTYGSQINTLTSKALNTLCQQQGATLFMGLQAAFSVLLARYSNETDIVVGSPIANREQAEVADLIGFFTNTLVLRSDLSGNPSFVALLQQSKTMLLDAYAHQQVSFEQIVERLQPERSQSHSALFQVMLVLQNNEESILELPGLTLSPVAQIGTAVAKYDLTLNVFENAQGIQLGWEYNTDLFEGATIARMAEHFAVLLDALLETPEENVFKVDILGEQERQLLIDVGNTAETYPEDKCIHERFQDQVEGDPDALALSFDGQQLSYGELNEQANQLAHYLINKKQVTPDTLVGICLERSLEMVISILAVLKAGGAYVPLDPAYPETRLQYMLDDAKLSTVLTQTKLKNTTPLSDAQSLCLDDETLQLQLREQKTENPDNNALGLNSGHLAYVIYTSGSTGNPKGVMIEHRSVVNLAHNIQSMGLSELNERGNCWGWNASYAFDASVQGISQLLLGRPIHVLSEQHRRDPSALSEILNDLNVLDCTPMMVESWFAAGIAHKLPHLIIGGEAISPKLWTTLVDWQDKYGKKAVNVYGPTECTVDSTGCVISGPRPNIGTSLANNQLYVLNDAHVFAPRGVAGELYIGGAGVARGYLNRDDLTSEKFVTNPFYDSKDPASYERLYKTGDLVRWLGGEEGWPGSLEFLGRLDDQVKIRGFRVELGEIENALITYAQVKECIVVAKTQSSGEQALVAYIVSDELTFDAAAVEAHHSAIEALRHHLSKTLPEYMIPSAFMLLSRLPLTANGKVNRKALPEPDISTQQTVYIAPRNDIETMLCDIWQDILGVERVGIMDHFFLLGGHSLLVMKLLSALTSRFGITGLEASVVFNAPVLKTLATYLTVLTPNLPAQTPDDDDQEMEVFQL